jgi:hypothetical protein
VLLHTTKLVNFEESVIDAYTFLGKKSRETVLYKYKKK